MQATVHQILQMVRADSDLSSYLGYRRVWADKSTKPNIRNVAVRFWDADSADRAAAQLTARLTAEGYTNQVRRTSPSSRPESEYLRVQAVKD